MHSPPYPNAHLFIHPACIYNVPDRNGGPANKGIYKYIRNRIYRINEKEGNRNYPNGDLTKDVLDMV